MRTQTSVLVCLHAASASPSWSAPQEPLPLALGVAFVADQTPTALSRSLRLSSLGQPATLAVTDLLTLPRAEHLDAYGVYISPR